MTTYRSRQSATGYLAPDLFIFSGRLPVYESESVSTPTPGVIPGADDFVIYDYRIANRAPMPPDSLFVATYLDRARPIDEKFAGRHNGSMP